MMGIPDFVGDIKAIFEEIKELKREVDTLKRVIAAMRAAMNEVA